MDWRLDLQDPTRRDFLGPEDFGRLFGGRGISNEHELILYGDRNNWFAAYTYWYLRYYGHDKVKLLNGPRERRISEGRATSTEEPSFPPVTYTASSGDESIRARREDVQEALDDAHELVDVGSPRVGQPGGVPIETGSQSRKFGGAAPGGALVEHSVDPLEQVGEDPSGRAPDQMLADQVRVGPDRDPSPDQAPLGVSLAQLA